MRFIKLTAPWESIAVGLYVLELTAIIVLMPVILSLGKRIGSLFEPGGIVMNFVVFETARGDTIPAIELLSKKNVIVCGSATLVGLVHVTLSPVLISTVGGLNTASGVVASPA